MSVREQYNEFRKKMEEAQKEMRKLGKDAFKEGAKELFDENPSLNHFGWVQYTPYFADGDVCRFSIHNYYVNGFDEYGENSTYTAEEDGEFKVTPKHKDLCKKVSKFMDELDEDEYENLFGDHVEVKVYRDKEIEIEDYQHD